jgi:hypothetical protein
MFIADGTHYIGPPTFDPPGLLIGSNTHLKMGQSTVLVRRIQQDVAEDSTIRNKGHLEDGNENIRISGGTIKSDLSQDCVGNHLGFHKAKGVTVENVRFLAIDTQWNMAFINSEDIFVRGIFMNSGTEVKEDGIHFKSCKRVAVSDCIIQCGDDCLAFTQEDAPKEIGDTTDVVVSNCYLHSRRASALKLLVSPAGNGRAIRRVRVSNIVAKVGTEEVGHDVGSGIHIEDENGQFQVSDVEIDGFWLDASFSQNVASFHLTLNGVRDVRFQKLVLFSPYTRARIDGCQDIELRDCVVDTPRLSGAECLAVAQTADCTNVRILGGRFLNAKGRGVIIGSTNFSVDPFEISNAQITGSTLAGLYVPRGHNGLVSSNTITGNTGLGVFEEATSSANLFVANRLQGNGAGAITANGANSQVVRNVTAPQQLISDSGGFRQTIDGWYRENVAANLSNEELRRNPDATLPVAVGRFRAARAGSVTGIVVTSTQARTAGTLTVTAYKNTGLAGAAGSSIGLTATLNGANTSRVAATQAENVDTFLAGDELYIVVTTDGSWAPTSVDIRCALEIED